MDIVLAGLSFKTAPLELREQLATPLDQIGPRLQRLLSVPNVAEAVLVSTCNRVELCVATTDVEQGTRAVHDFLQRSSPSHLGPHLYTHVGALAVTHLFRVTCSLDSMVVGEPQILGQVKDAFTAASSAGTTGPILEKFFQRAFQVAKRVRTETGIAKETVSMAAVAVDLAREIFENLGGKRAVLLGAGDMAELAAKHLSGAGVAEIIVTNRSFERARRVAESVGGSARAIEDLPALYEIADIVISSTSAPSFVIGPDDIKRVAKARRGRPLFLIDLAVPRDVDPRVGELRDTYLYDVDALQDIANRNRDARAKEAARAEAIVGKETEQFGDWMRSLAVVPTIVALREKLLHIGHTEAERALEALGADATDAHRQVVKRLADSIINKVLHAPTTHLRRDSTQAGADLAAVVQQLFELELQDKRTEAAPTADGAEKRAAEAKQ